MVHYRLRALMFVVMLSCTARAQSMKLRSEDGHLVRRVQFAAGVSAANERRAIFQAHFLDAHASQSGAAWFAFTADVGGAEPASVTIRVPIAGTDVPVSDSRSCTVDAHGQRTLVFTAGRDDANAILFAGTEGDHSFSIVLNSYLCRLLAEPFVCGEAMVMLPRDLTQWRVGDVMALELESGAVSELSVSPVTIGPAGKPFDLSTCAVKP